MPIHLLSSRSHYRGWVHKHNRLLASVCGADSLENVKRIQTGGKIPWQELIWSQAAVPDGKRFPHLVSSDPTVRLCCHGDVCREEHSSFLLLSTNGNVVTALFGGGSSLAPSPLHDRRSCIETVGEMSSFLFDTSGFILISGELLWDLDNGSCTKLR